MATDHHQSAFDQDEYERYDTFDDAVAGTEDPQRHGFFGDFSRLIDQIRINNAASKLADNVSIGEDRALTGTGNWAAVPHEELYASVHTNNNPAEAYALSREWTQLGNMMAENSRVMDETIRSTEAGWTGPAAEVARQATLKLATWGGDAAQTSQYMGTRIADQGLAAERAKAAMPEPKNFDYEGMLVQGFASGGLAGLAQAVQDVQAASAEARSAHQQAAQVMADMEAQSKTVDETTPRFVRPPETTNDNATMQNTLMGRSMPVSATPAQPLMAQLSPGEQGTAERLALSGSDAGSPLAATAGGAGMPGATTAAFAGGGAGGAGGGVPTIPAGGGGYGGGTPDFSAMAAGLTGGGSSSGQRAGGTYTPPNINVPDIPMGTTTTAGYTPSDAYNPNLPLGGHPGGTNYSGPTYRPGGGFDPTNLLPPNLTGGRGGGGDTSYTPGKINPVTGLPFTPDEIRRGLPTTMRGGMPGIGGGGAGGGFGGGGAGGFGGGGMGGGAAGFGRGGMPGMGQSVGAVAAAEQAAARNAASAAMAGQAGANGQPGMGGAGHGAGRSGGGDDKEHRNKYASNEKVVEEPGRMVPSVIGEKSAKQLKEEQGG